MSKTLMSEISQAKGLATVPIKTLLSLQRTSQLIKICLFKLYCKGMRLRCECIRPLLRISYITAILHCFEVALSRVDRVEIKGQESTLGIY